MLHMRRFLDGKSKTGTGCALGDTDGCPGTLREGLRAQGPLRAGRVRALARTAYRTLTQGVGSRGHARSGGGATAVRSLRTAGRASGGALSGSDGRWAVAAYGARGWDLLRAVVVAAGCVHGTTTRGPPRKCAFFILRSAERAGVRIDRVLRAGAGELAADQTLRRHSPVSKFRYGLMGLPGRLVPGAATPRIRCPAVLWVERCLRPGVARRRSERRPRRRARSSPSKMSRSTTERAWISQGRAVVGCHRNSHGCIGRPDTMLRLHSIDLPRACHAMSGK
jgi:hypothetical protein